MIGKVAFLIFLWVNLKTATSQTEMVGNWKDKSHTENFIPSCPIRHGIAGCGWCQVLWQGRIGLAEVVRGWIGRWS